MKPNKRIFLLFHERFFFKAVLLIMYQKIFCSSKIRVYIKNEILCIVNLSAFFIKSTPFCWCAYKYCNQIVQIIQPIVEITSSPFVM